MSDNWMNTRSNKVFEPQNPTATAVDLDSIAWALAHIPRFGGQARKWWSVADHCVTLTIAAHRLEMPPYLKRALLLHDAAEAYVGDMVRSVKNIVSGFKEVEREVTRVIAEKYRVPQDHDTEAKVKEFDLAIIRYECGEFFPNRPKLWNWEKDPNYPDFPAKARVAQLVNWYAGREPVDAYHRFLKLCRQDEVLSAALDQEHGELVAREQLSRWSMKVSDPVEAQERLLRGAGLPV